MKELNSKLLGVEKLTEDVFQFDFDFGGEEAVEFKAGQFFMIKVADGIKPNVNRSYSLASPPEIEDHFSLCIKLIEGGRASEYLRDMPVNTEVKFMAPFGHFYLQETDTPKLMIATGTGLAPFMSMLPILLERGFKKSVTLLFGVRHEKDLFYIDQLKKWAAEHENFNLIVSLSRPDDSWEGESGRVTEHLEKMDFDPENIEIYICGNGHMVMDVRKMALERGVPKTNIHLEQFTTI